MPFFTDVAGFTIVTIRLLLNALTLYHTPMRPILQVVPFYHFTISTFRPKLSFYHLDGTASVTAKPARLSAIDRLIEWMID